MDEVLALSEKTWQHANGTGIGSTPAVRTFYTSIAAESGLRGQLEIALLREGGKPIAFELNLAAERTVYNLKLGFDPGRADLSPGLVLRDAVLRRAIDRGISKFDFLGMAEPYKLHWTDTVRAHGNLLIARKGLAARSRWWLKFVAKPWLTTHASWVIDAKRSLQRRLGGR
jgi:CelD/BcsL family acetyltransferase involved in cellulose biosynthesis